MACFNLCGNQIYGAFVPRHRRDTCSKEHPTHDFHRPLLATGNAHQAFRLVEHARADATDDVADLAQVLHHLGTDRVRRVIYCMKSLAADVSDSM